MGTPSFGFSRAQGGATGFSPAQGGSAAAWTPESLTGLVDEWDAAATYCTTDGASDHSGGATVCLQGDGTNLQTANSFTFAGWFRMPASFGTNNVLWSKRTALGANEHEVNVFTGGTVDWRLSDGVQQNNWNSGTLTASTFHHLALVVDESAGTAQAYIDGATSGSAQDLDALSWDYTYTNTVALQIGAVTTNFGFQGRAQAVGQWDRALSGSEISALYNSGSGALYEDLTTGLKTSLVSWWNLHEASGARVDSHGSNDLTAVNTPGVAAGVASGTVQDRAPVKTWTGRRNSVAATNSTIAEQPTWVETGETGTPALLFSNSSASDLLASSHTGNLGGVFAVAEYDGASFGGYRGLVSGGAGANEAGVIGNNTGTVFYSGAGAFANRIRVNGTLTNEFAPLTTPKVVTGYDTTPTAVTGIRIGQDRQDATRSWNGEIAHVIAMASEPSSDEIASAESYLATIHGITLA